MFDFLKKRFTAKLIIELINAKPHYEKICVEKTERTKQQQKAKTKISRQKINI